MFVISSISTCDLSLTCYTVTCYTVTRWGAGSHNTCRHDTHDQWLILLCTALEVTCVMICVIQHVHGFSLPLPVPLPLPLLLPLPLPSRLLVHLLPIGVCIHTDIVIPDCMIEKPDPAPLPQALSIPGQSRDKRSSHLHCVSLVRVSWYSLVTWTIPGQFSNDLALPALRTH